MKIKRKFRPFFVDERGDMYRLSEGMEELSDVLLITCKKGSIRANHYHKVDTHYSYMLEGEMEYSYKDATSKNAKTKKVLVKKGDLVITPPMEMHAMKFTKDSVFLAITSHKRNRKTYEDDTVRINLI